MGSLDPQIRQILDQYAGAPVPQWNDDIVTRLVQADLDGDGMSDVEFAFFVIVLFGTAPLLLAD